MLEKVINNRLKGECDLSKKFLEYQSSNYQQIKEFLNKEHRNFDDRYRAQNDIEWEIDNFSEQAIYRRGRYLAICFYEKVIGLLT